MEHRGILGNVRSTTRSNLPIVMGSRRADEGTPRQVTADDIICLGGGTDRSHAIVVLEKLISNKLLACLLRTIIEDSTLSGEDRKAKIESLRDGATYKAALGYEVGSNFYLEEGWADAAVTAAGGASKVRACKWIIAGEPYKELHPDDISVAAAAAIGT